MPLRLLPLTLSLLAAAAAAQVAPQPPQRPPVERVVRGMATETQSRNLFVGCDADGDKVLYQDENGMLTVLSRMAPGSTIPLHTHTEIEQTYILEGSLDDEQGSARGGKSPGRSGGAGSGRMDRSRCAGASR